MPSSQRQLLAPASINSLATGDVAHGSSHAVLLAFVLLDLGENEGAARYVAMAEEQAHPVGCLHAVLVAGGAGETARDRWTSERGGGARARCRADRVADRRSARAGARPLRSGRRSIARWEDKRSSCRDDCGEKAAPPEGRLCLARQVRDAHVRETLSRQRKGAPTESPSSSVGGSAARSAAASTGRAMTLPHGAPPFVRPRSSGAQTARSLPPNGWLTAARRWL